MPEKTLEDDFGQNLRRETIRRVCGMRLDQPWILEIGTARSTSEGAQWSDGWSTKWWAEHVAEVGGKLYSIDKDPYAISQSKEVVPEKWHDYVVWIEAEGPGKFLTDNPGLLFDIVYLDGSDCPYEALMYFGLTLLHRQPDMLVLLDDTQQAKGFEEGKATYVLSVARRRGWDITHTCGNGCRMSLVEVE
jgi:predicted O-methyltransferase YrrM